VYAPIALRSETLFNWRAPWTGRNYRIASSPQGQMPRERGSSRGKMKQHQYRHDSA
jgi:hypothetical protein